MLKYELWVITHVYIPYFSSILFSLGCQEHMIPALTDTPKYTTIVPKCRERSMQMLQEFNILGIHAGFSYTMNKIWFVWHFSHEHSNSGLWFSDNWHYMFTSVVSDIVGNYWADSPRSMLPIYQELIAAGLRIWMFRYIFFLTT